MKISIRAKIMAPIVTIITLFLVIMIFLNYQNSHLRQLEQEEVEYQLKAQRIIADMQNIFDRARLGLEAVAENPEIQKAFAQRDRERLMELTMPIQDVVSGEGIEQFQFHLPPATSFLRLHMPEKFDDDLSDFRFTVIECNENKQIVEGLEEGRGGFGFRVVTPMFYQGQHTGSVEFGPGLNLSMLEQWQQHMGGEYYIYSQGHAGVSWEDSDEGLIVGTGEEDCCHLSRDDIQAILDQGQPTTLYNKNSVQAGIIIPLEDYSGKPIGYVKVVNDRSKFLHQANAELRNAILQAVLAVVVIVVTVFIITTLITRPIVRLSQIAEAVGRGDFTQSPEATGNQDEIGVLSTGFAQMVASLKVMAGSIKRNADKLASHSEALTASSEEVNAAVEEVASTTVEVAKASSQSATGAEKAADEFVKVHQLAQEGNHAVDETVQKVHYIAQATENVSTAIGKLGEQSGQIEQFINTITNIADMTNLLALNAAIEAARAGEHGRGFAVVAEEVRQLAEQSSVAAEEVTNLVKEIQAGVEHAINAMSLGTTEVSEGVQIASNAGSYLQQIIAAMEYSSEMISNIAGSTGEASDGTEQIAASSQEIAANIQDVSKEVMELSNIADELHLVASQFKVEDQ